MSVEFDSVESALTVLSDSGNPGWGAAFQYLAAHPETEALMRETFSETLAQMGVEPSGTDPASGEPVYSMQDMAKALNVPQADLDRAIDEAGDA